MERALKGGRGRKELRNGDMTETGRSEGADIKQTGQKMKGIGEEGRKREGKQVRRGKRESGHPSPIHPFPALTQLVHAEFSTYCPIITSPTPQTCSITISRYKKDFLVVYLGHAGIQASVQPKGTPGLISNCPSQPLYSY